MGCWRLNMSKGRRGNFKGQEEESGFCLSVHSAWRSCGESLWMYVWNTDIPSDRLYTTCLDLGQGTWKRFPALYCMFFHLIKWHNYWAWRGVAFYYLWAHLIVKVIQGEGLVVFTMTREVRSSRNSLSLTPNMWVSKTLLPCSGNYFKLTWNVKHYFIYRYCYGNFQYRNWSWLWLEEKGK